MISKRVKVATVDPFKLLPINIARATNNRYNKEFKPWLKRALTNLVHSSALHISNPDTNDLHVFLIPTCFASHLHLYQQINIICESYAAWIDKRNPSDNVVIVASDIGECFEPAMWKTLLVLDHLSKTLNNKEHDINHIYATAAIPTDINYKEMHELGLWSNYKTPFNILYYPNWANSAIRQQSNTAYQVNEPTVGHKPNKILCYNNSNKSHRAVIAGKLLQLKDSLPSAMSWLKPSDQYFKQVEDRFPDQINAIKTITEPLKLNDWTYEDGFCRVDPEHAKTCHVGLVTETVFYQNYSMKSDEPSLFGRFCTEKTWKCINTYMPFILVTRPHTLQALRNLGFKTFDQWWDEGYDTVIDDLERLDVLIKLLDDLSTWTETDWISFSENVVPIVLHNKERINMYTKELYFNGEMICRM